MAAEVEAAGWGLAIGLTSPVNIGSFGCRPWSKKGISVASTILQSDDLQVRQETAAFRRDYVRPNA
jgi:hypothetical protein